jgi:hypothetical protein
MAKKRFCDFEHSPGPWSWDEDGKTLRDARGKKLLEIADLQFDEDANVIVAGPALVAACRRFWRALRAYGPTDDGTPEGEEVERAMDEARDALLFAKYAEEDPAQPG